MDQDDEEPVTKYQRFYSNHQERLCDAARVRMRALRKRKRMMKENQDSVDPDRPLSQSESDAVGVDYFRRGGEGGETNDGLEINEPGGEGPPERPESPNADDPRLTPFYEIDAAIEDEQNRLTPYNEIDHFDTASRSIHEWLAEWGGLESWPEYLDSGYMRAQGCGRIDQWVKSVLLHADRGRLLENLLGQMETTLPPEMWKIRELWRRQTKLLGLVIKALTLIEVRVDAICNGPFNVIQ